MTGISVRLFCLPSAGVPTGTYLPWATALAPAVAVTPVELPGRGIRPHEHGPDDLEPLLHDLVPVVTRRCDRPFALFGHGLGALLAYELAARLEWERDLVAERLYVSGLSAPRRPHHGARIAHLPDTVVHCPVTVLSGGSDDGGTGPARPGWRACTRGAFRVRSFRGGHSFLHTSQKELCDVFAEDLTGWRAAHRRFPVAERTF